METVFYPGRYYVPRPARVQQGGSVDPHPSTKPPKIVDVAKRAGVSLSTVSRVMNQNPTVDPVLAARVRKAAKALNYHASPLARSLVLGRTQTVSVVVPDLGNPTFQAILRGLSRAAKRQGYHVLIADSAEAVAEEGVLAVESRRRSDGLVLCAPRMEQSELDALLPSLEPVVLVNRESSAGVPTVAADYRSALRELGEHLYGLGHRRFVFLSGVPGSASNRNRLVAVDEFRRAHEDVDVQALECGVGFEDGAVAVDAVLDSGATAALAYNDLVAMGLLSAVTERGLRVPDDLSIVGFDDIPFTKYTNPPLTTSSVPAEDIGEQAWVEMSSLLAGNSARHPVYFRPRLVVRASTAPVQGAEKAAAPMVEHPLG